MKCDLNHDLQKQVDKLACKLAEIAEYAPCCVNVCPIGNPSNCNAECEESDKFEEGRFFSVIKAMQYQGELK